MTASEAPGQPRAAPPRRPLWQQIAEALRQEIQTRVLKPGDRIPTEQELTQRFAVNRHTVRRALAALAESGVVRAEQGRGTFVQAGLIDYPITRRTRFSETMRTLEREAAGALLGSYECPADLRTAAALGIPPGAPTIVLETARQVDGFQISVATHIFSKARFPDILQSFQATNSITAALAAAGVGDYVRGRTRVSARLPTPEEVRLLQIPRTRPLLVTESIDLDMAGTPIELGITRFPADRMQLVFEP